MRNTLQNRIKTKIQAIVATEDNTATKKKEREIAQQQKKEDMIRKDKDSKKWLQERVKNGRSQPSLIERFKKSEKQKGMMKGTETTGSLMNKFAAMKGVQETLKRNGIEPKGVLTQDQMDDLADAEYMEKNA